MISVAPMTGTSIHLPLIRDLSRRSVSTVPERVSAILWTMISVASERVRNPPNIARLWLGTPTAAPAGGLVQLETNIDDMNPQNVNHPVETVRVDLYAYSSDGLVMFDDVVVKDIGPQTLHATDDAMRPATTQP